MSLVHEALQKAERERQRKTGAAPSAPAATPVAPLGQSTPAQAPRLPEPIPSAPHPVVSRKPAPLVEAAPRANQFLLPVLIGCVAIVAMIAIVFLVSNATSVLRQPRENPPVTTASIAASPIKPDPTRVEAAVPAAPSGSKPAFVSDVAGTATTTPQPSAPASASKYKLSGIMRDPDGKYVAVLNGRVAYEGYYIDGATLKKIEQDRATIEVNGREQVLRLF